MEWNDIDRILIFIFFIMRGTDGRVKKRSSFSFQPAIQLVQR